MIVRIIFKDENIVQQLIRETECLKQAIEDRHNDPRDAIQQNKG